MNYYNKIKETLVKNEIYKKAKDYSKNKSDLNSYFEVGRLLIEAQGGEKRAKYGNKLIKEYSERLIKELGKGYNISNLKRMRAFYMVIQKGAPLAHQLTWSHYVELLPLKNIDEIKYYIYIIKQFNLSKRELRERIKSHEYKRLGKKFKLEEEKIESLIKNPIIIKTNKKTEKLTEYALHKYIIEDMDNFLKELGIGFAYIGNEVKIKTGGDFHRIDFLLYNVKFNCYVVIELKINSMKAEYIGQIKKYMNYVDKHIKEDFNENTVGVIICKKGSEYVLEYCSDERIFTTHYEIVKS